MDKDTSRRLLLFGAGSLLFLLAWYHFFPPPKAQPPAATAAVSPPAAPAQAPLSAPVAGSAAASAATSIPSVPGAPAGTIPAVPAAPAIAAEKAESFTLKSKMTAVTFSNQGAVATSWKIDDGMDNHAGRVELVHPSHLAFPLHVSGEPAADAELLNKALWRCVAATDTIDCEFAAGGLVARKKLALQDNFLHELNFSVTRGGAPLGLTIGWGPGFGPPFSDDELKNRLTAVVNVNTLVVDDSRAKPLGFKSDELAKIAPGPLRWYGLDNNFYGAVFVPKTPLAAVDAGQVKLQRPVGADGLPSKNPEELLPWVSGPLREGFLFVGPKKYPALKMLGHALEKACGYDSMIPGVTTATVYLYHALVWLGDRVHNWGLAIILLTLLFRIALLPITFKSMVNMRVMQVKMKRIQKKVDDIRAKHKKKGLDGMTAMQEEMGKLYKKHGINQFGMLAGCLPVLLQMPLFFGFYNLLSRVIELKGQPFLHLKDLTAADPWYIMPILSGLFMFISSWMSAQTVADKGQRMMLMFSPLIFAFFFLYYPAGLSLYWAVSNLFTIGQMKLINHYGDKKVAEEHGKEKLRAELAGETD